MSASAAVTRGVGDRRRAILGYGIGLGLMTLWVMALYPSVEAELADYVDAMPEAMKTLFGMDDISSLAGFVHAEIFSLMGPIVFIALAITTGAGTLAGEERSRVLPLLLATGVGRGPLLVAKWAALAIGVLALTMLTLIALLLGTVLAGGGLGIIETVAATIQLGMLGLLFGTLALALGAATGSKTQASGISAAVALGTYLIDALAKLVDWMEPLALVSPFHWYAPSNPLISGFAPLGMVAMAAVTAALAGVAVVAFERRDVGV